jgi:hypothetical protein
MLEVHHVCRLKRSSRSLMEEASEMSFVYAKEDFPREKSCEENMENPESRFACAASLCYNRCIKREKGNGMFKKDKYYVFASGWQGLSLEELKWYAPEAICDTYEEAMEEVSNLWDTVLDPDDGTYVYYNGEFVYKD